VRHVSVFSGTGRSFVSRKSSANSCVRPVPARRREDHWLTRLTTPLLRASARIDALGLSRALSGMSGRINSWTRLIRRLCDGSFCLRFACLLCFVVRVLAVFFCTAGNATSGFISCAGIPAIIVLVSANGGKARRHVRPRASHCNKWAELQAKEAKEAEALRYTRIWQRPRSRSSGELNARVAFPGSHPVGRRPALKAIFLA
jgi:hypothetical protein